jgi:hypothetical protein
MKKLKFEALAAAVIFAPSFSLHAFENGDLISFDPGNCLNCSSSYSSAPYGVTKGSYFGLDLDGNRKITIYERVPISPGPDGGIVVGSLQPGPGIDTPWMFFGAQGYHRTTITPITQNADGSLDFTGLEVYWNGGMIIPLGGGYSTVSCGHIPCTVNDAYKIDYYSAIPSGPFQGIRYQLHLENIDNTPSIDVNISVNGGYIQECAAIGGHIVTATAQVTTLNGAQLQSIQWSVDGQVVATGPMLSTYVSLGVHSISATATAVTGQQDIDSKNVTIRDSVPPTVSASFFDNRTGSAISTITTNNTSFVGVRMSAIDTCDAYPATSGIGGFSLNDGDMLKVQGNLDKVELKTSVLEMLAKATDASGNKSEVKKTLSITP